MAPPVSPARGFVWLLIGLGTLGALGTDLYLPAARGVAQDLGASPLQLQQVLSAYLIGMGVMNLWLGALADRLGRRGRAVGDASFWVSGPDHVSVFGAGVAGVVGGLTLSWACRAGRND